MKNERDVIAQIMKAVGRRVSFHYPTGEKHKLGRLVDRVVVRSNPRARGVPYWCVVDRIEFPQEKMPMWMRIGYYRKSKGHLQWASQTTATGPIDMWKRILTEAANQKPWFRDLLMSVVADLKE
jgi:hypothetical protein